MKMEQIRVDCLTMEEYGRHGEDLIENAQRKLLSSGDLLKSMDDVFVASSSEEKVHFLLVFLITCLQV